MASSPPHRLRILVDANILFSGSIWFRFPYEVLRHAVDGDVQLVLSPQIIKEARENIRKLFPERLTNFENILEGSAYEEVATPTLEAIQVNSHLVRDIKDIHVALAAIDAQVDYLVTSDRDFTDKTPQSQELHEKINIILPAAFLRQHMKWSYEDLEMIRYRK